MFVTPGSTTMRWLSRSTSRIRRIRERTTSTPSSLGTAPPDRPEPAPRATHGTCASWQRRTTRWTCSALSGSTTMRGVTAYWSSPSDSYVRFACGCVTTYSAPTARSSSASNACAFMSPRLRHHPVQHARRLEVREHGHERDQDQAPLEHLAEQIALLAHHPHSSRADREVLRRDHLAEHAARAVGRRKQQRVEPSVLRGGHL